MANAVAPQQNNQPATLREKLTKMAPEFKKALPGHIPVDRFIRTVQTAIQMNPQIAKAATATEGGMQSLFAACTKAATDGLIIDGREAALVTFNQKVSRNPDKYEERIQYLPMVAGLMKKARNSGVIESIAAHVVFEKDYFEYELGDDEKIIHRPAFGERGKAIAVYGIVRLKDGGIQREVMDKAAVMRIAAQSKNANQYNPESGKNYGEWWRKTAIRRISKYLPSSSDRDEFMQAVSRIDDDFDLEATNGGETIPVDRPANAGPKKRGGAAAILKDVTPKPQPVEQDNEPQSMDDAAQFYAENERDQDFDYDRDTGEIIEPEQPKQQQRNQRQASNQRQPRQQQQQRQASQSPDPQPGDDI